jgi:uncharacterized protein involved in exopolysaccharide biosynthesis
MSQTNEPLFQLGFRLLLQHLRLFLALTFAGALIALGISYLFAPQYKADLTLIPSEESLGVDQNSLLSGVSSLASLVGAGAGALGSKQSEAIAVLKSRGVVLSYIQAHDLLPVLFPKKWDATAHRWKSDKKNYVPTLEDGYNLFDKSIRNVVENRKNNVIIVYITWRDPKLAKQWADDLVDSANDLIRQQAIERSTHNLEYLTAASEKTNIMEVKNSIYKIMESEIKKQMIALGNKNYAFRVVDPAIVPERKVFPKHTYFAAFGGAVGAMIWFFLVAFRDRAAKS